MHNFLLIIGIKQTQGEAYMVVYNSKLMTPNTANICDLPLLPTATVNNML